MSPLTEPTKIIFKKDPVLADPYYHNVSLLLHGDGTNGSTTIIDSSPSPKTVTAVGDAQISTTINDPFGNGTGVLAFDKVDDRLTLAADSAFAFGAGDFTIEFWAYSRDVSGSTQRGFLQISETTGGIDTTYANGLQISQGQGVGSALNGGLIAYLNNSPIESSSVVLSVNTWHHIALARASNLVLLFVNGSLHASATNASNLTASNLVIGGYYSTSYLYDGYIDELRITKGVARYTSNFTPPTAPFPEVIG